MSAIIAVDRGEIQFIGPTQLLQRRDRFRRPIHKLQQVAETQKQLDSSSASRDAAQAAVTRTSWAIREKTRTLRAEIDLFRKDYDGLRPGMYVNTKVLVRRSAVYALPNQALTVLGNQTYCYLLRRGKAVKTPVQAGIGDGTWVEVDQMETDNCWRKGTGDEAVVLADLSELTDGQTVKVM